MGKNKTEIEIINGDGSNLDISEVYDHLNGAGKPKSSEQKPKDIVIPEEHKSKK